MKAPPLLVLLLLAAALNCAAAERPSASLEKTASVVINQETPAIGGAHLSAPAGAQQLGETTHARNEAPFLTVSSNARALNHRAVGYALNGNYDAAISLLSHVASVDGTDPEISASLADILSWKGDLPAATKTLQKLVTFNPDVARYWLKLANVYAWQGRTSQAITGYETALRLEPDNIDAYIGLSKVYRENHQYADAESTLRNGLIHSPSNSRITNELAELAANEPMSFKDIITLTEITLFVAILLIIAHNIWRERRVLRRRLLVTHVLTPALLATATLMVITYIKLMLSGAYYKEFSTAAQLLEPLLLGILFTLIISWRLHYNRPMRQKTILAIGAHPDDIEFGCGATLLRLRAEGAATYGLVLTGGEHGHKHADTHNARIEEACSAAGVMALCDISVHNFPDTSLHEYKATIRKTIEDAITRWRPDIIFTHNGHDIHTDHQAVFDATREAARGAYTILCYENPNTPPAFRPGYYFDVSDHIDGKIAALACHKTQKGKPYASPSVIRAMAGFRGNQARVSFAEGFEIMRVLEKAHHQ